MDTGCTQNMTNDRSSFSSLAASQGSVHIGNNATIQSFGSGSVKAKAMVNFENIQ